MKKERFLILRVREDKKLRKIIKNFLTLTPLEDGFLKNFNLKRRFTLMRKILAIILVALMALSFIPLRNTKTVSA
ncbi:MAG: hypothetical protein ACPLW7_06220, partial [Minisyncoccia bacterium]